MLPGAAAAHPPALQSLNLTSYIVSLAPEARSQLYGSPWTCQAVFRALEPLAQQYALRLLYAPDPLADGAARTAPARLHVLGECHAMPLQKQQRSLGGCNTSVRLCTGRRL